MAIPDDRERYVQRGPKATIEYAFRTNGTSEAKKWLKSLPGNQQMGFGVLFERLATTGRISNTEQFRLLHPHNQNVWEFKRYGQRLFCVKSRDRFLLTHGAKKGAKSQVPAQIDHAKMIAEEHFRLENSS